MSVHLLSCGAEFHVDDEHDELVSKHAWYAQTGSRHYSVYVARTGRRADGDRFQKTILLHRELMGAPANTKVCHLDGDGLNNRTSNLRLGGRLRFVEP